MPRATPPATPTPAADASADDDEEEGLAPEDDWVVSCGGMHAREGERGGRTQPSTLTTLPPRHTQVPGTTNDSLTSNTALGRAVASACEELEVLADLERDAADRAAALLRKLGYRGTLLDREPPGGGDDVEESV